MVISCDTPGSRTSNMPSHKTQRLVMSHLRIFLAFKLSHRCIDVPEAQAATGTTDSVGGPAGLVVFPQELGLMDSLLKILVPGEQRGDRV